MKEGIYVVMDERTDAVERDSPWAQLIPVFKDGDDVNPIKVFLFFRQGSRQTLIDFDEDDPAFVDDEEQGVLVLPTVSGKVLLRKVTEDDYYDFQRIYPQLELPDLPEVASQAEIDDALLQAGIDGSQA